MNVRVQVFTSAVARRIFLFAALSVLVPFVTVCGTFLLYQRAAEVAQDQVELKSITGSYATSLYEALTMFDDLASQIAANHDNGVESKGHTGIFRWLIVDRERVVTGNDVQFTHLDERHFANDRSVLRRLSISGEDGSYLIRPIRSAPATLLLAPLDDKWFSERNRMLPSYAEICIFQSDALPFYCSDPRLHKIDWQQHFIPAKSHVAQLHFSQDYASAYAAALFLAPRFLTPEWRIVLFRQRVKDTEATALDSLAYLILALSLLVSIYFISVLVRRFLEPLQALKEGTGKVLQGDFRHAIEVESSDEFAELAESFNVMSRHVGRQLDSLKLFAEIDHEIIVGHTLEDTLQGILQRLLQLLESCEALGVCIFDVDYLERDEFFWLSSRAPSLNSKRVDLAALAIDHGCSQELLEALGVGRWDAERTLVVPIEITEGRAFFVLSTRVDRQVTELRDSGQLADIGERLSVALSARIKEQQLHYLAYYDSLTGLPSRDLVTQNIERELARIRRSNHSSAVMFVDLDRFKDVNDSYGHDVGDRLLQQVAERFQSLIRESDLVSRFGGDEFVFLLTELNSRDDAAHIAQKLIDSMRRPFLINELEIFTNASIGIAMLSPEHRLPDTVFKNADTAMYGAKETGRGQYRFFEPHMDERQRRRTALERDLRHAISRDELALYYQPQFNLDDGSIRGVEALLRWNHPEGLLLPGKFVSLAEDVGLIHEIGHWILQRACEDIARINRELELGLKVGVNLSPRQFEKDALVGLVRNVIDDSGIAADMLDLEITESVVLSGFDRVVKMLQALRSTGMTVSIDDFGTGYSSLSYLQRLPIDTVKIDQAFVKDIDGTRAGGAIAYTVISMAHNLGFDVIAEGVEGVLQLRELSAKGCDGVQGRLLSAPLHYASLQRELTVGFDAVKELLQQQAATRSIELVHTV